MGYRIVSEDEVMPVGAIVSLFYGEPGIGKTSLGFTANKPLLEDFDRGVMRSVGRKTFLSIDSWEDAVRFHHSEDFKKFEPQTLIIDTAGTMLDNFIAEYAKKQDPKNSRSGGELSLQGYGSMKSIFNQFVNDMRQRGIDIIFICHAETFKDGDEVKYRPKVTGGSYDILMSVSDMVGYMESKNNKRTIEFNPTDRNIGKNTAEFDRIELPHYSDDSWPTFCADLIQKTKDKMTKMSEAQEEAIQKLNEFKERIRKCDDITKLEEIRKETDSMSKLYQLQLKKELDKKYFELYEINIVKTVTDAKSAQEMLDIIREEPDKYQSKLQNILKSRIDEINVVYDGKEKKFVDPEKPKKTEKSEPEKEEKKKPEPEKPKEKKESGPFDGKSDQDEKNGELPLK